MTDLRSLPTPAAVIDRTRLQANVSTMASHLSDLGVGLRPHFKTVKSIDAIRLALEGQPGGVTVSTLREAEHCVDHGIADITYAVGISADKLDRVVALEDRGADISILLDTLEQARSVMDYQKSGSRPLQVLIEIDSDGHRGGVEPQDPLLVEIGSILSSASATELRGVLTHAGESYNCFTPECLRDIAHQERDVAIDAAQVLRDAGLPCPVVSVGSTPTALSAQNLTGVTEVRAGVYMTFDLVMAGIGVCSVDDIALSVLTTVIGHQAAKGWIIIDAGWMALSRDRGTAGQPIGQGYGLVCDIDGRPMADLIVTDTNQEHGIVTARSGEPLDLTSIPIGSRVRILPNHACATGAMHDRYEVVDGGQQITTTWDRIHGW